ncbi:GGDEF domain-containing protein [Litoribacillus peritrichatus]|uniref:diguanylate cyclase n=1 Tax=Litoribacillus peritrichatus TaxID=718191 RepID=A0ABP7MH08_9GAMM
MHQITKIVRHLSTKIFEGSYVEKSQCIFVLIALATACFSILLSCTLLITDSNTGSMDRQGYQELLEISSISSLYCLILFMVGNYIRSANNRWYPQVCLYSYVIVNAIILFYIGVFSIGTGIALAGAPIIGLIIFNRRMIFSSLFSGLFILLVFSVFIQMKQLDYAPIVMDKELTYHDPVWLVTMMAFVGAHLALLVLVGNASISRWKKREAEVTFLSTTDPLTQISNRRQLMDLFKMEYLRAARSKQPISIFLVDLDHFKQVNDAYGHQSGDEALKSAADTLKETLRETDLVGRYGGEEFLAILPNTDGKAAVQVADRFRRALQAKQIALPDGQVISITASIGLHTVVPEHIGGLEHFLAEADKALYQAKHNGRNQVTIALRNAQAV